MNITHDGDLRADSDNGIRAVEKTFVVLDVLAEERSPNPVPVSYLVRQTGFHRSSIQRCLTSLIHSGYVEVDPDGAGYRITCKVLRLSQRFVRTHNLVASAHPYLVRLRDVTDETAFFAVLSGESWVPVSQEESYQPLRQSMRLGSPLPLACGAGGRAILAFAPEELINRVLSQPIPALGPGAITDPNRQRELFRLARQHGYTIGVGELQEGAGGIGGPVFDHDGRVAGTMGIGVPAARLGADRQLALAREVRAACEHFSAELGANIEIPHEGD